MHGFLTIAFCPQAVTSFLFWGYWEKIHWLDDSPLFRDDWSLKPSGEKFIELVFNEWWTNEEGTTNVDGEINSRGFLGKYEVKVTQNGGSTIKNIMLTKNDNTFKVVHNPDGIYQTTSEDVLLEQNYPNPCYGFTEIAFTLKQQELVELVVHNYYGNKVLEVVHEPLTSGRHQYHLDLSNLPAGMYVYQLKTETGIATRKINLIK